jgi:hypothetical protein
VKGPSIIERTMSVQHAIGIDSRGWQYHSRSDRHSKTACWAIIFDLLSTSSLLRQHVAAGKVSFAINRKMNNWQTGRSKNLDLVIARASSGGAESPSVELAELAQRYDVRLSEAELRDLKNLPSSPAGAAGSTVLVALEAKACMTAHMKARPRLFDELDASHSTVHGDNNNALAVGFAMVNSAEKFVSPVNQSSSDNSYNRHNQPSDTLKVIEKLREINRRPGPQSGQPGFDAFGIMVVDLRNDGTPMHLVTNPPAPQPDNDFHYDRMIIRTAHLYDSSFSSV